MPSLKAIVLSNGEDTYSIFIKEIYNRHKKAIGAQYLLPMRKLMTMFMEKGLEMLSHHNHPLKKFDGVEHVYELRTKDYRLFIYDQGHNEFVILHGYQKKSDKTPKKEITKLEGEIKLWIKK